MDPAVRAGMAAAMSRDAGVLRDHDDMERLQRTLGQAPPASTRLDLATVEATSLHTASVLVAVAALARAESRGCHRWRNSPPEVSAAQACHTVVRVEAGLPRAAWGARSVAGVSP